MVRGRPKSSQVGAEQIVATINALKAKFDITDNKLSSLSGITQSGISRSLNRKPPVMTPTTKRLGNWIAINAVNRVQGELVVVPRVESRADGERRIADLARDMWDGSDTGLVSILAIMDAIKTITRPPRGN